MALSSPLTSVLNWLHAGYPQGIPQTDYYPLLAFLRRQLTDDELTQIVDELVASGDVTTADAIRETITQVTSGVPADSDVTRVAARLAAGGWPLAHPLAAVEESTK